MNDAVRRLAEEATRKQFQEREAWTLDPGLQAMRDAYMLAVLKANMPGLFEEAGE